MNLQELNAYAIAGKVDELNLISMEGGIYLLEARMHGAAFPLNDAKGGMFHLRSVEHARDVCCIHFRCCHSTWCTTLYMTKCAGYAAMPTRSLKLPIAWRSAL
jgi:hypothetical protein